MFGLSVINAIPMMFARNVDDSKKSLFPLQAEQASLQQWIDDIREAHRDEVDALQHERDAALADEVMTTQSALESMQANHAIELKQERSKVKELQEKASQMIEVERDLLLHK